MNGRWFARSALAIAGLLLMAAAGGTTASAIGARPPAAAQDIAVVVFLLGDAGKPDKPTDPVLRALHDDVQAARMGLPAGSVAVAFLGDNVYENGVPEQGARGYSEYVRRLMAQVEVLGDPGAAGAARVQGVFVPGNHDWAGNAIDGWGRIRRQGQLLDNAAESRGLDVSLLPADGCPGPVAVDVAGAVRLIAIDTQWWLRTGPKPTGESSSCATRSVEDLLAGLDKQIAAATGRLVIVLGHHPVASGGPHGGHLALKEWFWPAYNLIYYPFRKLQTPLQDLGSRPYAAMIAGLLEVYAGHPPLLMASGHEHNLQVIEGDLPRYQLVSGSGSKRRAVAATSDPRFDSLFWSELNGYMRLDVHTDGRVMLTVTVIDDDMPREAFSLWLEGLARR